MAGLIPEKQRQFALEVVRRLREAGFEAYWAGGCVRDQLLGRVPKDYDVATSAVPPQIRELFGHRRTLAIGVAFGVITILGPSGAGQIEVATFRQDATYSDGRHPDRVTFSNAREDALRRVFTINGLFFDPIAEQVLDYVGGSEDLQRHLVRAIGDPLERFREDKLRLLRAVRFAAAFGFELDPGTFAAIRQMAPEITVVSPERIAQEMRRLLEAAGRARGLRLLVDTGLSAVILPEVHSAPEDPCRLELASALLAHLRQPRFALALAALLHLWVGAQAAEEVCQRWRLANKETERVRWLVEHQTSLDSSRAKPWSALQPILVDEGSDDLLNLTEARALVGLGHREDVAWCRQLVERPRQQLDPPPLLTGDDLIRHGIRPGPQFKSLLQAVRDAQLDDQIHSRDQALTLVDRLTQHEDQ
jgi:tRNA nucleotidyltransferase/poly(A) polymerase